MGFGSINEIGNKIVSILNSELVPDVILHNGMIGMCSPEDHGDFLIGIYLYDVGPNEDISQPGIVNSGANSQTYPSSYLTARYMITAYSSGDLKYRSGEDHRIMGRVIQALSDNSRLGQTSALYGKPMATRITLERLDPYEKLRLWTFPNQPYKLTLFYKVAPIEVTSGKQRKVTRVTDIRMLVDEDRILFNNPLVVLCTDSVTGRPVTGSNVRVYIEGMKPPVTKEDGYRVFVNTSGEKLTVRCESGIYKDKAVEVDMKDRDDSEVLEVVLEPSENYPGAWQQR